MADYKHQGRKGLLVAFCLTVTLLVLEVVGGYWSHSLALLSDAGHMVSDAGALLLSLAAMWLSSRPPTPERTYGWHRTEILAALVNALTLVAVAAIILKESYERMVSPQVVLYQPMLVIAAAGLAVNLLSALVLRRDAHSSLNVRGAFLHVLGDALGSVGVIVAGLVIWFTGWELVDPIVSVLICCLIVYNAWGLIKLTLNILLEATPPHVSYRGIREALQKVPGVENVHDLHIWTINTGFDALSCHIVAHRPELGKQLLDQLTQTLRRDFGIDHSTIQIEANDTGAESWSCDINCQGPEESRPAH